MVLLLKYGRPYLFQSHTNTWKLPHYKTREHLQIEGTGVYCLFLFVETFWGACPQCGRGSVYEVSRLGQGRPGRCTRWLVQLQRLPVFIHSRIAVGRGLFDVGKSQYFMCYWSHCWSPILNLKIRAGKMQLSPHEGGLRLFWTWKEQSN